MFQKQIWVKIVAVALTLCTLLMVIPLNVWADSPAEEPIQRMADAQPAESFHFLIFFGITYGNGATVGYAYDAYDRVTSISYDGAEAVRYVYDKSGNLYEVQDLENDESVRYSYDLTGRPTEVRSSDGSYLSYAYDTFNRISQTGYGFAGNTANVSYLYGDSKTAGQKTGLIYGVKQNGSQTLSYTYDALARVASSKIHTSTPFVTEYTYLEGEGANSTTTLVKTMKVGSDTYGYTYDDLGNITQITKNGTVVESYEYDSLSQLTKVTNSTGVYVYTYDDGGNITSVTKDGTAIKSYTYGDSSWKDLLTAFNGDTITYDNIGNPLTYRDGMTFTWENGRQLASVGDNISYTYNADGNRISKTVNNVETEYYWLDGVLLGEKTGTNTILYLYDDNGVKYGFDLNGTRYYYILNLQGDVIGILTSAGVQVVSYTYDAWGNLLSTTGTLADTVGQINPIRYRGYYYDAETEFYFLNTRYYDPETGRFINADGLISTGQGLLGYNMFAYCLNNPVNLCDPSGMVALVDDLAYIGLGILAIGAIGITYLATTPEAQRGWSDFGNSISSTFEDIAQGITSLFSKPSSKSGKEKATDKPSWVNKGMVDPSLSAQENAKRILDNKYGSGGWKKGPKTEFNRIVKWITRSLTGIYYVPDNIDSSGQFYYDEFGNYMYSVYSPNSDLGFYSYYRMYVVIDGEFWQVFE